MLRRLLFPVTLLAMCWAFVPACNLSDDSDVSESECLSDDDCPDGVCDEDAEECHQCIVDEHCTGDEICRAHECLSGCDEFDCGDGGNCIDEDSHIFCECDDGHFLDDGICRDCDCDIASGTGECESDGTCVITSCDDEYFTEDDDPTTGCECGPDDWPDPVDFTDRNCDGVDGDASRAVFVSPFGDDDHDGIRTRPVETINRALEIASDSDTRDQIFIAEGEYDETIRLHEGISLFGGYFDAGLGEWERGHDFDTVITGEGLEDGHRPVEIAGVEDDVELQLLTLRADDAPASNFFDPDYEPSSSVGLTLFETEGHITVSHLVVDTGHGAFGRPGHPGAPGDDGEDGGNGYHWLADDNAGDPGQPTSQSCAFSGNPDAGAGGAGRESGENPSPSEDGDDAPGSGGGEGGKRGLTDVSSSECGIEQSGTDGEDGTDATIPGDDGDDGQPASGDVLLQVTGDELPVYRGPDGEDGTDGQTGYGGGGGGGGGGSDIYLGGFGGGCASLGGGGGGAGGNGGCGGEGGRAGQWGGASIGIVAFDTSISVLHSDFILGDGGEGGTGGPGGDGGDGGQGGIGGEEGRGDTDNLEDAGGGGAGSSGGDAGGGPGGLGGPSLGILHGDADLETDDLSFDLGEGGPGGEGAGDDNDGLPGLEEEIVEADAVEGN